MNNNLPTTPGSYWWREKDGDEWKYGEVYRGHSGDLYWETMAIGGQPLDHMRGQWAKAHKPDDGQEAFAVRCPNGQFTYISTEDDCDKQCEYLNETDMFLDGQEYNVVPVTIYRKEKE